ncbi:MAG: histidine phosphatase family protein [Devosia sp.]
MTLTLYLLRHAKSDQDGRADFDRPLSKRGAREAVEMGAVMSGRGYRPGLVLCSGARRTRETLAGIQPALTPGTTVEFTRRIYDASAEDLLDLITEQPNTVASLMLIGHNPGFEQLATALAGSGDGAALARLRAKFPPAGLAVLGFDAADWADVRPGDGRLEAFETPSG